MFFAWVMCVSVLVYSLSEVFFIEPKYILLLRASRSVVLMCVYSNWSLRVLGTFLIYQILFVVLRCPWLGISVCNIFSGRTWHFSCLYFYCAGSSLATSSWMYFGFALVSSWWHLVYANCWTARAWSTKVTSATLLLARLVVCVQGAKCRCLMRL